jgi:hypothetical protein
MAGKRRKVGRLVQGGNGKVFTIGSLGLGNVGQWK